MLLPPPVHSPFVAFPIEPLPRPATVAAANPAATLSAKERRGKAHEYEGYDEFSKWMASDDDCFIIRRFEKLNARVILYMQERISQIEQRLIQIHEGNAHPSNEKRRNDSIRWDARNEQERDRLMRDLTGLLHHYNQYIETFSKIRARPQAEDRQIRNLEQFVERGAIWKEETRFVEESHDLISIHPHVTPPLGKFLESISFVRHLFPAKANKAQSTIGISRYSSDAALQCLSTVSIILLGLGMLLGPDF